MLNNKIVIVTGAGGGIGKSIFLEIIRRGGFPIGIDITPLKDSPVYKELIMNNLSEKLYKYYNFDIRNIKKFKKVISSLNRIDGIVNNAAILGSDNINDKNNWKEKMSVNVEAHYNIIKNSISKMHTGASIVNIGSIELNRPEKNVVVYTSTKGALLGLTRAYSTTLASKNIRVNMVSPSRVFTEGNITRLKKDKYISYNTNNLMYSGKVEPIDVSNLVCFLLSNESIKITGQNICIDCSFTLSR